MNEDENRKKEMVDALARFSDKDFTNFIPNIMLRFSETERLTVEFVFWFCYVVERDLDTILKQSAEHTKLILGSISKETDDFLIEKYGIDLAKIDPTHPDYDAATVTFGNRIFFVEQLRGKTKHVKFLWKVKKIRDDLSHGRIKDLQYEKENLIEITTKRKMLSDYITLCLDMENEEPGGFISQLTDDQKDAIDSLWREHEKKV